MKVLFFNYEYPPLGGGAGNACACLLAQYLKMAGLEVDLVTSGISDKYEFLELGKNIRVHKLPIGKNRNNLHFQSQKDLLVYAWKAFWFSRKLFKKNKYDLTHSFFTVPCGFLSLIFYFWKKIPYIVSLRGADVPGYAERFGFMYKILSPLIKIIWKKAAFVVSNSQGLKDLAMKTEKSRKIEIIYNGIDIEEFKPSAKEKSEFILTPGGSRLTQRKGINYAIEAVGKLSQKYPQVNLHIIGEGEEKEKLKELAESLGVSEKVKFLGRVDHKKIPICYREADVFVLPSLNEGMSNAMLEALSTGLPILATETGGTSELLKDGENGFIIKMKDSADIAEKTEKLIKDSELRKRMGEKSREKALEMSWQKAAERYFSLYEAAGRI